MQSNFVSGIFTSEFMLWFHGSECRAQVKCTLLTLFKFAAVIFAAVFFFIYNIYIAITEMLITKETIFLKQASSSGSSCWQNECCCWMDHYLGRWEKSKARIKKKQTTKTALRFGPKHTTLIPLCTHPVAHYCFEGKNLHPIMWPSSRSAEPIKVVTWWCLSYTV